MLKRAFDLAGALVGLIALAPVMLVVAGLVRLTSSGPALFRQWRVGRSGRDLRMLKFRTMAVREDAEDGVFDPGDRSRITPVGHFLRRAKLDELPQLWNVLCGDMSLVGPRPEVRRWVDACPERWEAVHAVRPGITDPASLLYRDEEALLAASADPERTYREEVLPRKLDLYERYVRERSFAGDLKLIIWTAAALLGLPVGKARGARPQA
ncbi:MAG: sugar transferase [Planctomycetota bacterium]|jgi:lipopolysaccharide/colanic/teichoic acid biosynthesis glycosyltransferase